MNFLTPSALFAPLRLCVKNSAYYKSSVTCFILLALLAVCTTHVYAEDAAKPAQNHATPDFTPPKDLSGPVFPAEDFIGEPPPETNRFVTEFVSMLATLGLIISLILVFAWFLKRMLNTRMEAANETSLIKVLERRTLSPKTLVYLLEIDDKVIVIAESHNGVVHLANYPADPASAPTASQTPIPSAFNKLLNK